MTEPPVLPSPGALPEVEARHVAHVLEERLAARGDGVALRWKERDAWKEMAWGELRERVEALSSALVELGVAEGDRVALLGPNRPEWTIADLAILRVRGVSVPIHATSSAEQVSSMVLAATRSTLPPSCAACTTPGSGRVPSTTQIPGTSSSSAIRSRWAFERLLTRRVSSPAPPRRSLIVRAA